MWDAYIVWTLDDAKLRNISSFYNCTNHLNHTKPTWGNQMISCRKIWKICGHPSEKENKGVVRGNGANFNVVMHKVRCSIQAGIIASTIPGSLSCLKILYLPVPCRTCRTVIFRLCEALILKPGTLYSSQKFIAAVVQRFQNINPDSDSAHIKGLRDLKNEIQIITLSKFETRTTILPTTSEIAALNPPICLLTWLQRWWYPPSRLRGWAFLGTRSELRIPKPASPGSPCSLLLQIHP